MGIPEPARGRATRRGEGLSANLRAELEALAAENARLSTQLLENEGRFRHLARAIWAVQEGERRRLAADLHDGLGQVLTALANQLQRILDDARAQENVGLEHRLADALAITRSALKDTRELSRLLRPSLLDDLGLDAALHWLVRSLGERTGQRIEYSSNLGDERLPGECETLVFRITQEALTNVLRHADATRTQVQLTRHRLGLRLEVTDDGCGFDPATLDHPQHGGEHAGLRGMRERAALFGGRLWLDSRPGHGTRLQLELTLNEPAP